MQRVRHQVLPLLLIALVATAACRPAMAAGDLRSELAVVSETLARVLKGEGTTTLSLGSFPCRPAARKGSAGPGIANMLEAELKRQGVLVNSEARFSLSGEYRSGEALVGETRKVNRPAAMIICQLIDKSGKVLGKFTRHVVETESVSQLFGLTMVVPPDQGRRVRDRQLLVNLDTKKPQSPPQLKGAQVAASAESPYAIELLVKAGEAWQPRSLRLQQGLPFASIKQDELYAVRLINNSAHEAAVSLSIDGLSLFAFSNHPEYRQIIVAAKSSTVVPGWIRTKGVSDAFQITTYAKSAAKELSADPSQIGMIHASFAAAWPQNTEPPEDELRAILVANRGEKLATGRGPSVAKKYEEVERHIGVLRAAITVRYAK